MGADRLFADWEMERFGEEEAWVCDLSTVCAAFGRGPSRGGEKRAERLTEVAGHLVGAGTPVCWAHQIHGCLVASVASETGQRLSGAQCVGRCDGLITAEPGVALAVWTADCVPVLIAGAGVVAAVHAGWRGAAAGIVRKTVRRLEVEFGLNPDALEVALGPAVEPDHYQVGPEVVDALAASESGDLTWAQGNRVDLRAYLTLQLTSLGVTEVTRVGGCTACSADLASYRRDGQEAGRQWSMVALTAPPGVGGVP